MTTEATTDRGRIRRSLAFLATSLEALVASLDGQPARVEAAVEDLPRLGLRHRRTGMSLGYHRPGVRVWYDWLLPPLARPFELLYVPPSLSRSRTTAGSPEAHWMRRRGKRTVFGDSGPLDLNGLRPTAERNTLAEIDAAGLPGCPGTWGSSPTSRRASSEQIAAVRSRPDRGHEPASGGSETGAPTCRCA